MQYLSSNTILLRNALQEKFSDFGGYFRQKIKKARFGNFTKRGEIKPAYPQADCGYERKKPYSAGFVLGRPVTRVTVLIEPRLRKRSMRSKRLRTLRFLEDAEPPLLKLLCWDIILSFYKINKTPY